MYCVTDAAINGYQAEALRQARYTRAQARRTHMQTVRVAEQIAATQDRAATLMGQLAEAWPQDAPRLLELSAQARQQADRERDRAYGHARDALLLAAAETSGIPAQRASDPASPGSAAAGIGLAVLWEVVDTFGEGVALVDGQGAMTWVSARLEATFGYQRGELAGQPVEVLVPRAWRKAHRRVRSAYAEHPRSRLREDRPPLAGLRKDGTHLPVEISLSPVRSPAGPMTLALVRKTAELPLTLNLAKPEPLAASQHPCAEELQLFDRVITGLFVTGIRLQGMGILGGLAGSERRELLNLLDGLIMDIRDHVFDAHGGSTSLDG
jgi:PAS domain S-box-containing protein